MTETRPGPDELRVRGLLRKRGVGPDAEVPPLPPAPARLPAGFEPRARDWLDDILDTTPDPAPAPRTAPDPDPIPEPVDDPDPDEDEDPARAEAALSPRIRWLLVHATAAAAGWPLGLVRWGTDTAAWLAAGHWTSPSAWAVYSLTLLALALYRRTRHTPLLAALLGAMPVSSVALGVLLYGTP